MSTLTTVDVNDLTRAITQAFESISSKKKSETISSSASPQEIARRIKTQMKNRDMNQRELAKIIGLSLPAMNDKINGKKVFTLPEAFLISEALHVPFGRLYFKYP